MMNGESLKCCDAVTATTTKEKIVELKNIVVDSLSRQRVIYANLYGQENENELGDESCVRCMDDAISEILALVNRLEVIQVKTIERLGI